MCMENRAGPEEANAGDDLRGDARRIAVWAAVGGETDLRDVDGQMGEERGTEADENIRTQPRGFAGDLALEADGAAEQRGEHQLEQQYELQGLAQIRERGRAGRALQQSEQGNYEAPRRGWSAHVEIAHVS